MELKDEAEKVVTRPNRRKRRLLAKNEKGLIAKKKKDNDSGMDLLSKRFKENC